MAAPKINKKYMSASIRNQIEAHKKEFGAKRRKPKITLTPENAGDIVKRVQVSEDTNRVKILLNVDPGSIPTAQQKGAFVGKDGKVHFFTKAKIAKAGKALALGLSPYAHLTARWGRVPIQLTFDAYFSYPTGTPKKNQHKIGPHLERPDGDNLLKLPADILTDIGFWEDDSVIGTYIIRKRRTTGPACIQITIENLDAKFQQLYKDTMEYETPTLFSNGEAGSPSEINPLLEFTSIPQREI